MESLSLLLLCSSFFVAAHGSTSNESINRTVSHKDINDNIIQLDDGYKKLARLFLDMSDSGMVQVIVSNKTNGSQSNDSINEIIDHVKDVEKNIQLYGAYKDTTHESNDSWIVDTSSIMKSRNELNAELTSVANEINTSVRKLKMTIKNEIDKKFISVKADMRIDDKLEILKKRLAVLNNITDIKSSNFMEVLRSIGFETAASKLTEVQRYQDNITELSNITNIPITIDISFGLFAPAILYLNAQFVWYNYLEQLFDALNADAVHTNRNVYNLQMFNQGNASFQTQIEQLDNLVNSSALNYFQPSDNNQKELNDLILLTLSNAKTSCPGNDQLLLTGYNIRMSEIFNASCSYEYSKITVFAFNAFYLDTNYTNNKLAQMSIISPKWNIRDTVTINISGAPGSRPAPAVDGHNATDGQDGMPGYPGSQGGSLFGMASEYKNAHLLTVNVNGGSAGDGQNGGRGGNGNEGHDAQFPKAVDNKCDNVTSLFNTTFIKNTHPFLWGRLYHYTVEGEKGTIGMAGGNGGVGGDGGLSGQVELVELSGIGSSNSTVIEKNNGQKGMGGFGGQGGRGGRNGDSLEVYCNQRVFKSHKVYWFEKIRTNNNFSRDGIKGEGDYNTVDKKDASYMNRLPSVVDIVNRYIESYHKQFGDDIYLVGRFSMKFVSDLQSNY